MNSCMSLLKKSSAMARPCSRKGEARRAAGRGCVAPRARLAGPPMTAREELKLYFDYKSPFAYLAKDPAFALPDRYAVSLRWIPFVLRIKGKGERSIYSEHKARYSYFDARRWANRRGGFRIMGPLKVYDSTP